MRRTLRLVSVFLLVEMLLSIFSPTVVSALTAGPTAPEATSFEPVDTTDMVDLKTGDFTYSVPLLEVPGPSGGYPIALSYHAGIQNDQEASWTGLGWTLNPGSIARIVNGYPDDHGGMQSVDRSYWKGGSSDVKTIGLSYGITGAATVSAGLSFANDTYRGRSIGGYIGADFGISNTPFSGNVTLGISPYGGAYSSVGISTKVARKVDGMVRQLGTLGLRANSDQSFSLNASVGPNSLVGASINTGGAAPSFSIGGATAGIHNSRQNHVSIFSAGFMVDIPIYWGINIRLGRQYTRYWIDETSGALTYGSLYAGNAAPALTNAFDTYDITDTNVDVTYNEHAEKVLGASFPDVDLYTVMGQGLSGNIAPYSFRQHLNSQDKVDGSESTVKGYRVSEAAGKPVEYRFVNDFSNRFEYNENYFGIGADNLFYQFDDEEVTTGDGEINGYDLEKNHLAGSKHVEWYSNSEILLSHPEINPYDEGFISTTVDGFTRESNEQVGGFMITNTSGVTYHFALPAYSHDEYMKSVNSSSKQETDGLRYNELYKPGRYAYTWYLTAVTGPDYVDRNENHLADKGDWGYWVNMTYAKYVGDYRWRNPGTGVNRDLDGEFENFSRGKKELYYLKSIATETHIAVFEKSERLDGREVLAGFEGFSTPIPDPNCQNPEECVPIGYTTGRPSLRLDKVRLYNQKDYAAGHDADEYVLKAINFEYDYSLAPFTPNSFDSNTANITLGKLTLKKLSFHGKRNVSLLPPMTFAYAKNPIYHRDYNDVWGYHKSDFDYSYRDATNEILGHVTTETSGANVDAWSLTEIKTSLGATIRINYESDRYDDVALANQQSLRIRDVTNLPGTSQLQLNFWEEDFDFSEFFHLNDKIDLDLIGTIQNTDYTTKTCVGNCDNDSFIPNPAQIPHLFSGVVNVDFVEPTQRYIRISNIDLYNEIGADKVKEDWYFHPTIENDYLHFTLTFTGAKAWPDFFPAGVVGIEETERFGGGLRVASIELGNSTLSKRVVAYEYTGGTTSCEPYNILEPKIHPDFIAANWTPLKTKLFYKKALLQRASSHLSTSRSVPGPGVMYKTVAVKETNVTSDGQHHALPGYSEFVFQTFTPMMVEYTPGLVVHEAVGGTRDGVTFSKIIHNKSTIRDFASGVGSLKSITLKNTVGNAPLSKTTYHYLYDKPDGTFNDDLDQNGIDLQAAFGNQGFIEETYTRARILRYKRGERIPYPETTDLYSSQPQRHLLGGLIQRQTYPTVQVGQTNNNYKTGIESKTNNVAFDFYSGEPTTVLTRDSYGTRFLSTSIPAYRRYPQMGLKLDDPETSEVNESLNRNMLSQKAVNNTFVLNNTTSVKDDAITGLLSATAQTWSNTIDVLNLSDEQKADLQAGAWRQHASYQWEGPLALQSDGSYPYEEFVPYNFSSSTNNNWQKIAEQTLYDVRSHGLEEQNVSGIYSASRMDPDQVKVIASTKGARYYEMAASGAEYMAGNSELEGGVERKDGVATAVQAHSGRYSLLVGKDKEGFSYTLTPSNADLSKKYKASVWVYAPGTAEDQSDLDKIELYYTINGQKVSTHPIVQKNKSKSWYLLNLEVDPMGANDIIVQVHNGTNRGIYFDDFRVHPLNAAMTTFVYDQFSNELTYLLDHSNLYTSFEYDAMGRLVRSRKELMNFDFGNGKESFRADQIIEENKYNFGKSDSNE